MSILDRYISKEFLKGFFYSLSVLIFIYIIADMFDRISMFIDKKVDIVNIILYYLYELPSGIDLLCPIAILIACFISVGNLSRHFEMVALRGAGVNPIRVTLSLYLLGSLITLFMFIFGETIIPASMNAKETLRHEKINKLPPKRTKITRDVYFVGEDNRFFRIDLVDGSKNIASGITIYKFSENMELLERIDAKSGDYKRPLWIFYNGVTRKWSEDAMYEEAFDTLKIDWLREGIDVLLSQRKKPETMNYWELKKYIEFRQRSGYDVKEELSDLYYKISYPFINLIIIMLGAALAAKVRTSGFVLGFAIAMLSSFLYWGITQLGRAFGRGGVISPVLGSWLPNIIFATVGCVLIYDMSRR